MRKTLRANAGQDGRQSSRPTPMVELAKPDSIALEPLTSLQRWSGATTLPYPETAADDSTLDSFVTAESEPEFQTPRECFLLKLPPELIFEICSHLDYPGARELKNTSNVFRAYITSKYLVKAQQRWKADLLDQDIAGLFTASERMPCYTCVRLRPSSVFPTGSPQLSTVTRCSDRACIDCLWKTKEKGAPIYIDSKCWTRCSWCSRPREAYRFEQNGNRPGLCGLCGRIRRLAKIWPIVLLHLAELATNFLTIVWVSWGSVQGWLVGYPGDDGWDKGGTVRALVIIPLIQLFLSAIYQMAWHHDPHDVQSLQSITAINFCYGVMGWIWALSEPSSINKADPRAYQLCVFVYAAGIPALILSFLRLVLCMCTKGKLTL